MRHQPIPLRLMLRSQCLKVGVTGWLSSVAMMLIERKAKPGEVCSEGSGKVLDKLKLSCKQELLYFY